MQFDADHLFALAGYAVADPDIMENHVRNGVPAIAEREYADCRSNPSHQPPPNGGRLDGVVGIPNQEKA